MLEDIIGYLSITFLVIKCSLSVFCDRSIVGQIANLPLISGSTIIYTTK